TNLDAMYALDRETGRVQWSQMLQDTIFSQSARVSGLQALATSGTAADEDHVMVGLKTGKLVAFSTHEMGNVGNEKVPTRAAGWFAWAWTTNERMSARPVFADKVIAFASQDGKLYVAKQSPPLLVYRFRTAGPISADLGTVGNRTLLVGSEDHTLYAVDL